MATSYRTPLYQKGDRGPEVALVQQYLASVGFSPGAADGVFGANTESAVKAFQQSVGQQPDGYVWQETFEELAKRGKPAVMTPVPSTKGGTAPVMVMDPMTIEGRMPGAPLPKWTLYVGAAAAAALAYYFFVAKPGGARSAPALAGRLGHCGCDREPEPAAPALSKFRLPAHLRYRPTTKPKRRK